MLELQARGAVTFDYGNNIRAQAAAGRRRQRVRHSRASCPSTSGRCSARARARSAGPRSPAIPADIHATDRARARDVRATTTRSCRWIRLARERVAFQGLPARIFWLGYGERARFGLALNDLVRRGVVKAPIVIGRDHLDTGSVASPNRETEGMRDGSDAIADWPVLNALLNTSSGATWVSVHHGGGVGIGYSLHAGMVIVADGTREADEKLAARADLRSRACGVMRHADAGYPDAIADGATARHPHADARARRGAPPMIVERPALERRVLRLARRRAGFRSCSAAAAPGARRCCCALQRAARRATAPVPRLRGGRDDARAVPRGRDGRRRRSPAARPRRRRPASRARGVRRARWRSSTTRAAPDGEPGDVPARRVPRHPHVRELPGPAPRAARPRRARWPRARRASCSRRASPRARIGCCATRRRGSKSCTCRRSTPAEVAGAGARASTADAATGRRDIAPAVAALAGGRAAYVAPAARGAGVAWARRLDPVAALAALFAPDGRLDRALPRELRVPPASRARLRRAQGDPRHPRRGRAAEPDRDRAAPAPHARLDEGLPVVARGRGPRHVAAASATRSTIRCCGSTCGCTRRAVPPTDDDDRARGRARTRRRGCRTLREPRSRSRPRRPSARRPATRVGHHRDRLSVESSFAASSRTQRCLQLASAAFAACCSASFFDRPLGARRRLRRRRSPRRRSACGDPGPRPPRAGSAAGRGRRPAAIPGARTSSPR